MHGIFSLTFYFAELAGEGLRNKDYFTLLIAFLQFYIKKKKKFLPFFNVTFFITLLAFVAFISWKSKDIELR